MKLHSKLHLDKRKLNEELYLAKRAWAISKDHFGSEDPRSIDAYSMTVIVNQIMRERSMMLRAAPG